MSMPMLFGSQQHLREQVQGIRLPNDAGAGGEQQSGEGKVRHASEEASQRASEERRQNLLRMAEVQRVSAPDVSIAV